MTRLLRVLVVDDVPAVAALHGAFVVAHPRCELVGTAATGPQAVVAMRELEPDLVLLDVHLPGFSGIDAMREIRADASLAQPDVIAVTAARDVETVRDARLMGARHYLVKPFTASELHQRIDDVLRERASHPDPSAALDQRDIDAVMSPVDRHPLPKGLTRETLQVVSAALRAHSGSSAGEIAEIVGLSRVSCRRYLEHLADTGLAARSLDYATAGRPSTRYTAVPAR
jgi:response regulator of citrate/malate metabolism